MAKILQVLRAYFGNALWAFVVSFAVVSFAGLVTLLVLNRVVGSGYLFEVGISGVAFVALAFVGLALLFRWVSEDFFIWLRSKPEGRAHEAEEIIDRLRELAPNPGQVDLTDQALFEQLEGPVRRLSCVLGRSIAHREITLRLLRKESQEYCEALSQRLDEMRSIVTKVREIHGATIDLHGKMTLLQEANEVSSLPWEILPWETYCKFTFPTAWDGTYFFDHPEYLPEGTTSLLKEVVEMAKNATNQWFVSKERILEAKIRLRSLAENQNEDTAILDRIFGADLVRESQVLQRLRSSWEEWDIDRWDTGLPSVADTNPLYWLYQWREFVKKLS